MIQISLCTEKDTHDYTPLQRRATDSQTNSHNFKRVLQKTKLSFLTVTILALKVDWDKYALINLGSCKKGERFTIIANSFTKKRINKTDTARRSSQDEKLPSATETNQIAGFVEFRPLTSWKNDKLMVICCYLCTRRSFCKESITILQGKEL